MKKTSHLFEEFQPVTKAEWLAKVEKDLKGKSISELGFEISGIPFSPFQHGEDLVDLPRPLQIANGWEIGEDIHVKNEFEQANQELLHSLENGVNAPRLILNENISDENFTVLLNDVNLEIISIHFFAKSKSVEQLRLVTLFLNYISQKKYDVEKIRADFNFYKNESNSIEIKKQLLEKISAAGADLKIFTVNGEDVFSDDDPADELLKILVKGESYLHQFSSEKYPPKKINQHLQFSVAIGKNYFVQIAKLRTLRLLWVNVLKAYNMKAGMPPIEAHLATSSQVESENTNMIAATTQAMSAIIGGADRLTILPADAYSGDTSSFTRRIARNVQHILQTESYFDRVADPAAGSYFVEKLTVGLAEKVWGLFQEKK